MVIYLEPAKTLLFFVIPIGLMITVPAQVLMNLQTSQSILLTTSIGIGFLLISLKIWRWSLKNYSSAGG